MELLSFWSSAFRLVGPVLFLSLILVNFNLGAQFSLPGDVFFSLKNNLPLSLAFVPKTTRCYQSVKTPPDIGAPNPRCFIVQGGIFRSFLSEEETLRTIKLANSDKGNAIFIHHGHAIPGLWDGHGHLIQYGEFLQSVNLFGIESLYRMREKIAEYVDKHPGAGSEENWIRGLGWDQNTMGAMPTAEDLAQDERLKDLFIMVDRVDVHCTLVSHAVLSLLGNDIPDEVPGGEIVRDPGMGVFCDNAMEMVYGHWPRPDASKKTSFIKTAMRELNKVGIVGVHDAGVNADGIELYKRLVATDDWSVRVYAMIDCMAGHNNFCPDEAEKISFGRTGNKLAVRSVKLFADGALGSWGSAMIEPYTDRPSASGSLLVNASTLTSLAESWAGLGYQVNIHAIGDLANRVAIDSLESALKLECPQSSDLESCQKHVHKFRIEHAQIIHPDDQARMRRLGIIPSIQPTHATSDMAYAELRLGRARTTEEAYRMRSLLALSPMLGSDFPVEPPDPFQGIYAAVARRNPHTGKNAEGGTEPWHGEEALSLEEAVLGFTRSVADGAVDGGRVAGAIRPGAVADWVVLDRALDDYDIEELKTMRVTETWVGGRCVYGREQD